MASRGSPFTLSLLDVPDLFAVSLGWRYAFGLVIPISALTLLLSVLGLSPAPVMVVAGVVEVQLFIASAQRRQARHLTPLLALEVIESPREHTAALAVGILSVNVQRSLVDNPAPPPELIRQIDLDRANFASNERLQDVMASTTATPEQIAEAVRINIDARQRALELSFLLLGGVALLVIVPVGLESAEQAGGALPEDPDLRAPTAAASAWRTSGNPGRR